MAQQLPGPQWGAPKMIAHSGIQIVYGGPTPSRQPPGLPRRGIGIKTRSGGDTWNGLLDKDLHKMRFRLPKGTLRLPVMGMPPREPTAEMVHAARNNGDFEDWFQYATVYPAADLGGREHISIVPSPVIWLDQIYLFETAVPKNDTEDRKVGGQDFKRDMKNLYYISLLPNELPSYHFWRRPSTVAPMKRQRGTLYARGGLESQHVQLDDKGNPPSQEKMQAVENLHRTQTLRPSKMTTSSYTGATITRRSPSASPTHAPGVSKRKTPSPTSSPRKSPKSDKSDSPKTSPPRQRKKSTTTTYVIPARRKRRA